MFLKKVGKMAKINGHRMLSWRGDAMAKTGLIGASRTHTLSVQRGLAEVAGADQGKAREYVPDALEWTLNVERLVLKEAQTGNVKVSDEVDDLRDGVVVNVCCQVGWDFYTGTALVTKVELAGPLRGKTTARVSLRGTGMLSRVAADAGAFGRRFAYIFGEIFPDEEDSGQ